MLSLKEVGNFLRNLPMVASLFAKKEDDVCREPDCIKISEEIERRLEMMRAFLFKQKPEYDEQKILYHGWIKALPEQRGLLGAMGVRGELIYAETDELGGWFNQCICGKAAMEALMLGFPTFWPGCFTACIGDEQLPKGLQEYWRYPFVIGGDCVWYRKWKCPRCNAVMKVERRRCGNCMAYRTYLKTDYL